MKYLLTTLIGLLAFATPNLAQHAPSATGILLVHYGTNNDKSRSNTLDVLNSIVAQKFDSCQVVEAYAAPSVIRSLAKRGINKLTIDAALDTLYARGCRRIVVQSTMLLDGIMTDIIKNSAKRAQSKFEKISVARPLLYSVADCRNLTCMIARNIEDDKQLDAKKAQVVLVGHGSDSPANAMYSQIDYLLKDENRKLWHVGTIEGYPNIDTVLRLLAKSKEKRVILIPLLYIAGNHQRDDIDGVWRNRLVEAGYKVSVVPRGLGEMDEIRQLICNNIERLLK